MNKAILITDKVHPLLVDGLKEKGFHIQYKPQMPYEEVIVEVGKYNGVIINSKVRCDKTFLGGARHLEFIGRLGSGLDIIDLPYAQEVDVKIISSPEGNANAVGEHTLGMLYSLIHNISQSHTDVKLLQWNREINRGEELAGKKVGIIGFGHTGPAFAKKLQGCGVDILIYDKYRVDISEEYPDVAIVDLNHLLKESDVVSIHLPLTSATCGMGNTAFFSSMKKGAILINTSRGMIVESHALLSALRSGHLSGACLDVLENEKPATWNKKEMEIYKELIQRKNVIITPHIAGWTHQSLRLIASILLEKICDFYHR